MQNIKIRLQPIAAKLNMPTVLKTAILPGESTERVFVATQVGEIFYIGDGLIKTFLDIRSRILTLGASSGGYDERGLVGLAFHPDFYYNGLFYLHYSLAGTQGPGALPKPFHPDPCAPETLSLTWTNREVRYDHIDTVEEWVLQSNGQLQRRRTLLNLRRPFLNHNGVNSLNFSPETGRLVLTTGDGGSGFDPFNLSQNEMEIAGKIIEIDLTKNTNIDHPPVVTRFNELLLPIQETLTVIAKGTRNITGVSFLRLNNQYIKYVGIVGQDLVESIYSFDRYKPVPVTRIVQAPPTEPETDQEGFINFGWRGWEGAFPSTFLKGCSTSRELSEKTSAYYKEAIETSTRRMLPLTCYYHEEPRPDKLEGTALTGVHPYRGNGIDGLFGSVVFADLARDFEHGSRRQARGALAYTKFRPDCKVNDYSVMEIDHDFGSESAFFVSLGANLNQTELFLGVYGSMNVADPNRGTVFRIVS